jgi:DNA-binding SARP family transcriptional activator
VLEIRLLGELEVARDGRARPLPASKKTRALLGYLAVTGRPASRDRLCELLWEGPDDPRAQLRWSLTKLRPLVDEKSRARLVADRERIVLEAGAGEIDLRSVREAIGREVASAPLELLREAAARFRGELLDGLDLPDCYRFQAWLTGEREAARALRIELVATLCQRVDEPQESLKLARAWVAIEPLSEAAHAQVVKALGALGRTRDALAACDEAKALLERELGGRLGGVLERARYQLTARPPAPAREAEPERSSAAAVEAPLVGRDDVLARFDALAETLAAGRARELLLLSGEPGLGKSRLLDELAARVRAAGGRVLAGRSFEAEMVRPYGSWLDALRGLPGNPFDGSAADRERLFEDVASLLAGLAAERPLLMVMDDLHWIDEGSAALLHYLARAPGGRVLYALGARPGELSDNAAALRLVRAFQREGRLASVVLAPLDGDASTALLRAVAPGADVARLLPGAAGNPLFLVEAARALDAGGDPLRSIEALIAERLERLDSRARALLPFAAALGHSFGGDLLARTSGLPPAELLAAVESLERAGVLEAAGESRYDFAHDLVRNAAYRALSIPRRRMVHAQIARALAELPDADGALASDLAHHADLGGDVERAAFAYAAAAERALKLFATVDAHQLAERGLRFVDRLDGNPRITVEMRLLSVQAQTRISDRAALSNRISRLTVAAQEAALKDVAWKGFFVLSLLQFLDDDFHHAQESTLRSVEAARSADPPTAVRAMAVTSRCLLLIERDLEQAVSLADEAQVLAQSHGLAPLELPWALGLAHYHLGDIDRAHADLCLAVERSRACDDHWHHCMCLQQLACIALERGRTDEALAWCAQLDEFAARLGEGSERPFGMAVAALARLAAGGSDWAAAERAFGDLRQVDARSLLSYALNTAAELALAEARRPEARRYAAEALAAAEAVERRTERVVALMILAALDLDESHPGDARARYEAVLPHLADRFTVSHRARAHAARIASRLGLPPLPEES